MLPLVKKTDYMLNLAYHAHGQRNRGPYRLYYHSSTSEVDLKLTCGNSNPEIKYHS